jgi:hypothetical protein
VSVGKIIQNRYTSVYKHPWPYLGVTSGPTCKRRVADVAGKASREPDHEGPLLISIKGQTVFLCTMVTEYF